MQVGITSTNVGHSKAMGRKQNQFQTISLMSFWRIRRSGILILVYVQEFDLCTVLMKSMFVGDRG